MKLGWIILFLPAMAGAAVENIISMQSDRQGTFNVMCDQAGLVSLVEGVTADQIREDSVCGKITVPLVEGLYETNGSFCGQAVRWEGTQLTLALQSPCAGTVRLNATKGSDMFEGRIDGYSYDYEVKVTGADRYTFYSRSFGTQADFKKSNYPNKPAKKGARTNQDPARP